MARLMLPVVVSAVTDEFTETANDLDITVTVTGTGAYGTQVELVTKDFAGLVVLLESTDEFDCAESLLAVVSDVVIVD